MFEKTLPDLIRGLRSSKKSEEKYVTAAMDEIRSELRKNDLDIKTNAVSKLCLLHMLGYDMSWASFHIVEVMSSPKLSQKRVGYAAAAASFTQSTSVLMLCTNLIKKDLASNNYMDGALAMHALAQIVTPDLGRDLAPDLVALLNHSRPYMRKRAVVTLYRVVLKYPEALRAAYPRLKERLDDSDQSVVGAAVNVICELARKNPKSYLPLAPQLYGLLTSSTNNWMLIKIIKLFAALTPLEPRLVRKLVPPIVNIIQTTPAMSLIYECIHTLIVGGMIVPEGGVGPDGLPESQQDTQVALLCGNKLKMLLENPDQNLKYLALYAFSKMLVVRPNAVGEHREMVLKCLGDADYSIRQRALELISNMANPTNLFGIVKRLLYHLVPKPEPADAAASGSAKTGAKAKAKKKSASLRTEESAYRADVARRILSICAKDTYANVTNFEWYLSVLVDLAYCPGIDVGMGISSQVIDICVRVRDVVPFAVDAMAKLVTDSELLDKAGREPNNSDVLYGAAWVVGEYCEHLADPLDVMDAMLSPRVALLSPATQAVYIHNFLKLYVWWAAGKPSVAASQQKQPPRHLPPFSVDGIPLAVERLQAFTTSADLEVQDRASMVIEILKMVQAEVEAETKTESAAVADDHADAGRLRLDMPGWFAAEVVPVNAKAQRRVGVPDGLDLDAWIHEPVVDADDGYGDGGGGADGAGDGLPDAFYGTGAPVRDSFYEDADRLGARGSAGSGGGARDRRSDPFYLGNADAGVVKSASAVDSVPIVPLSDLLAGGGGGSGSSGAGQPKTGGRGYTSVFAKPSQSARPFLDDPSVLQGPSPTRYTLRSEEAMPPGAAGADTDSDDDGRGGLGGAGRVVDPDAAAVMSIDLSGLDGDTAVGGWAGGSGHGSGDVYVEVLSGSGSGGGSGAKKAKSKKDKSGKSKGDKKGGAESGDKATKKKKARRARRVLSSRWCRASRQRPSSRRNSNSNSNPSSSRGKWRRSQTHPWMRTCLTKWWRTRTTRQRSRTPGSTRTCRRDSRPHDRRSASLCGCRSTRRPCLASTPAPPTATSPSAECRTRSLRWRRPCRSQRQQHRAAASLRRLRRGRLW
ncbi:adaptin N terminal region-domain-containing protein [Entophlyctis helioformis]|nr:adaptin N terminal region-domain-containing protein [Entophlyctis helioformis]